ncbi:spidroin-1-like [Homarus americanus]|uniref:spidroin-1-like n=1 Tax=Homarus americanus TaxID=6706 RepID=UPI001C44C94A|nr:spidroin-1-like [Homarus americanus]
MAGQGCEESGMERPGVGGVGDGAARGAEERVWRAVRRGVGDGAGQGCERSRGWERARVREESGMGAGQGAGSGWERARGAGGGCERARGARGVGMGGPGCERSRVVARGAGVGMSGRVRRRGM